MEMEYRFVPAFSVVGNVSPTATIGELAQEVSVYSATPDFIRKHCGPIAQRILGVVPDWYYDEAARLGLFPNADIRIHRLYPGDFPAYPGWHCDGEYRETYFAQPDLDRIQVHNHLVCTVSTSPSGVSNTQFLAEPFAFRLEDQPTQEITLWGKVHGAVEQQQTKTLYDTKDGDLVMFDSLTLHRAMPAKVRGWRLFFRMSMWHKPNLGDGGCISKQEQVYKLCEGSGW